MDRFIATSKPKQAIINAAQLPKTPSEHSDKSSSGGASHSENNSIFGPRRSGPHAMPPVTVRRSGYLGKNDKSSSSSHEQGSPPPGLGGANHQQGIGGGQAPNHQMSGGPNGHAYAALSQMTPKMGMMQISELKSEKFSAPNSIIKDRFFNSSGHVTGYGYQPQQPRNATYNGTNRLANYDRELQAQQSAALAGAMNRNSMHSQFTNQYNHHPAHHHQNYVQPMGNVQQQPTPDTKAMQTLQQIQEAKPGNKRAILTDLPEYLYSIPALASFFEPYGEVAMLQILPLKRMWDGDLIDLLGASMCNRLAQNTYCAIVEFYSARMAKFIIGILRKRLPILKFRCALLKPSAAIELTNQADNLGLTGAVRLRHIPDQKNKSADATSSSGQGSSAGVHETTDALESTSCSSSHSSQRTAEKAAIAVSAPVDGEIGDSNSPHESSNESGMDEMTTSSASGSRQVARVPTSSTCSISEEEAAPEPVVTVNNQSPRFVASLSIQLNR